MAFLYAWLAGLAFTASLAYFTYFYAILLGQTTGPAQCGVDIFQSIVWNIVLFGCFSMHHSVMARASVKRWITNWLPLILERSTYVLISSILFFAVCFWWRHLPTEFYTAGGIGRWLLYGLQLGGLALLVSSVSMLDVLDLAGIRNVMQKVTRFPTSNLETQIQPELLPEPQLIIAGPYRIVRHPLYLGWMFIVFGSPLMTTSRFLFACVSTAYLLLAIPWEERSMLNTFGTHYQKYVQKVRWRLIPGIF